jgi:hypothetical protein
MALQISQVRIGAGSLEAGKMEVTKEAGFGTSGKKGVGGEGAQRPNFGGLFP